MDRLPPHKRDLYESAFRVADAGYHNGRVDATTQSRRTHWRNWVSFVEPLGVDPYLQDVPYQVRVRCLSGFGGLQRLGYYGRKKQVQAGTVSSALTAVGQKIALAHEVNPVKTRDSKDLVPRLSEMLSGFRKEDPATMKKMPVEADVPELLVKMGNECTATELTKAVGDLALMAFYYLLRVGEYTVKRTRNCTKQTKQFKLEDVQFFEKKRGRIRRLARNASDEQIMAATSATLKLDNSKNGWKGVCVHQEANGEEHNCGVRAIGRRYCYIRHMTASLGAKKQYKTFLSAYWIDGKRCDVNDEDIRANIKWAAGILDYEGTRNIPVDRVDTHSLRSGGANALSLSGYSDRQIMKMGRWKSATFMEYIREELACFSEGMSKNMKRSFGFVNVAGGAYHDITSTVLLTEYDTPASAA